MTFSEAELAQAVESIASTAFEPARWAEALVWVRRAGEGEFTQVLGVHPRHGFQFHFVSDIPQAMAREFEVRGGGDPRINPRARIFAKPKFTVENDATLATQDELKHSAFLHDFTYRADSMDMCLSNLPSINGTMLCAAVSRNRRQVGRADPAARDFRLLLPHIFTATRLRAALESQGALLMAGVLDAVGLGAFLLAHDHGVVSMTAPAEALLRREEFLRLRNHRLEATSSETDRHLQAAIILACGKDGSRMRPRQTRLALRSSNDDFVVVNVAPLPAGALDLRSGAVALVTLERDRGAASGDALLRDPFGLTKAETDVARAFMEGLSTREIARRRHSKIETVRGQIKTIMHKTGTDSRTRLLRRLMPFVASEPRRG